ncbi:hypothetical protein [Mycobacteroides salmoniphilum]|uniref:Uncharacterized protein n=1 Tax=Mycobacteroides salmoniphilum TaxID=404941 RepID=A0A4R8SKV8_9MYCO|nr:hypothetical protein [Mycobacteroides salmoniphilum]TDZ98338.1 hypothetical protein CCUG60885_00206 [Mycobacteroides salmoniphilum]TEA02868.1 hypothetical protein CCUG60883_03490 [Mycobacteroides salmoniphilum]
MDGHNQDEVPDNVGDLSKLRAIDIPQELEATRQFVDNLARVQELNGANLVAQLPGLLTSFATAFMTLEMKLVKLKKLIDDAISDERDDD